MSHSRQLLACVGAVSNSHKKMPVPPRHAAIERTTVARLNPPASHPHRCACSKLYNNGLEGEIPSPNGWEFPPLLAFLDLGSNEIQGSIPPGWRLPDTLEFLALVGLAFCGLGWDPH